MEVAADAHLADTGGGGSAQYSTMSHGMEEESSKKERTGSVCLKKKVCGDGRGANVLDRDCRE